MHGPVGLGGESRPPTTYADDPIHEQGASWRFRNWRVRTKIVAILLIPLLAVVTLSGLRLWQVVGDMGDSARAEQLAEMADKATALAHELQAERDLSGAYIGGKHGFGGDELRKQRRNVDAATREYEQADRSLGGGFGPVTTDLLGTLRKDVRDIGSIREVVDKGVAPWTTVFDAYSGVISDLLKLQEDIPEGAGDRQLGDDVRALSSLSKAKTLLSSERGYLAYVFGIGKFDDAQFRQFLNLDARWEAAQEEFDASITDTERKAYKRQVTDEMATAVKRIKEQALADPTSPSLSIDVADWYAKASTMLQGMRAAELDLGRRVHDRASALHHDAQQQAAMDAGTVLAVLLVTLLLAFTVARSLVRPLRQLRGAATDIATRLPDTVQRLRSTNRHDIDAEVEPVQVRSDDEVGEVAVAFNAVHREAVRVAVEQALLRKNVSTIFVNLSRRTQSLVERQLRLIDDLEGNEENNDSLGNLFQLDHLATRMRRNAENLLVLAGADAGRRWSQPVLLLDVLRAATAEVEQYPRVAQTYVTTRKVDGRAVGDVVHLIAELLENALEFSSPETQVVVSARSLHGDAGVMVEIEDHCIGMSADELAMANERLATSTEIDVGLSRMMGLYVVGKLSARHDIRVQLRHSGNGGIVAQILLPAAIVVQGEPDEDPFAMPGAEYVSASVGAGVHESAGLADLGDHETRPIIMERTRSRSWPRGVLEDDYSTPQVGDGSGPQRRPPGLGSGDGEEAGSTSGTYLNPFDDFERAFQEMDAPNQRGGRGPNDTLPGIERPDRQVPAEPPEPPAQPEPPARPNLLAQPDLPAQPEFPPRTAPAAQPEPDLPEFQSIAEALGPPRQARPSQDEPPGADATGASQALDATPFDDAFDDYDSYDNYDNYDAGYDGSTPDLPTQTVPAPDFTTPALPRREPRRIDEYESGFDSENAPGVEDTTVVPAPPVPPQPVTQQPASAFDTAAQPEPEEFGTGVRPAPSSLDADVPVPEEAQDEFLPIYAQVESEWFRRRSRPADTAARSKPASQPSWESVADEGWRAAEQLAKLRVSGTTKAGLPVRVPMAHYVPGSVVPGGPNGPGKPATLMPGGGVRAGGQDTPPAGATGAGDPTPAAAQRGGQPETAAAPTAERTADSRGTGQSAGARSPEAVRGLLSSYHRGLRQGREAGKNRTANGDEFRTE